MIDQKLEQTYSYALRVTPVLLMRILFSSYREESIESLGHVRLVIEPNHKHHLKEI
jgi:hypothetical protein